MIAIISISKQGNALAARLAEELNGATSFTLRKWEQKGFETIQGTLKSFCGELFQRYDFLVFIMASGIVVRSIAPWVKDKTSDPAVLVIDDNGNNVISLLSGHLGGANALTVEIAEKINAHPVITTASDVNGLSSVDMIAKQHNLVIDSMEDAKIVTAMLVNGEEVGLIDESGVLTKDYGLYPKGKVAGKIIISNKSQIDEELPFAQLLPKSIILGMGCKRDTNPEKLFAFITDTCTKFNIDMRSITTIASIDVKADEQAILKAAEKLNCELRFYNTETLQTVDHLFEGSEFVRKTVGVASVSTTAAFVAGNRKGNFIVKKEIRDGMTISIFERSLSKS